MKILFGLALLVLLVPFVFCEETAEEPDVFVLTKDNFDEHIKNNEFVFVEFYAPWCGHCKKLAPDWSKLATKMKEEGQKVSIAKLDATQAEEVAQKIGVRGYPTLKFFRSGTPIDYEGGRTVDELYSYAVRKSGPPSHHLSTKDLYDTFVAKPKSKIVAFLSDAKESIEEWVSAATSGHLEDFDIAHITDKALFGDKKENTFAIFKEGDDTVHYTGDFKKDKILEHVKTEGFPLIDELAQKSWQRSQGSSTPLLAAFIDTANAEQKDLVKTIAKKFKGKVITTQSNQNSLAERWGATGKVLPTAILVTWQNGEPKFAVYDEESDKFTVETGEKFVSDALEGKYTSFRKSEPVPEKNDDPVKILVGKNFDQIVKDPKKDVLVEFYAPWCGHCKKLSPIWDELGEALLGQENVVIAKMDATANAPPEGLDIRGFPTIIFFPADNKEGVPYSGERDLDSFLKFIKEKASNTVSVGDSKVEL